MVIIDMRPEKIDFANELPVRTFVRCIEHYPYHWHDALEIIWVLKGSVNISIGSDDLLMNENDIAIINMDELHRIEGNRQDNQVFLIQIDSGFYRSILQDNRYFFIYCCSTYHESEAPEKYKKLKKYIAQLIWELNKRSFVDYKKSIGNTLTAMLQYITYNFDFLRWGAGTEEFDEKHVDRLKQMAEHISSDYTSNPGLKTLATEADISLQHLSTDIKSKFRLTFQELLCYSKCEHAAKLLLSTDERIVDIALKCGFSDVKYLIKHFKMNFRCKPSEFRKMYRADVKILSSCLLYDDYPLLMQLNI